MITFTREELSKIESMLGHFRAHCQGRHHYLLAADFQKRFREALDNGGTIYQLTALPSPGTGNDKKGVEGGREGRKLSRPDGSLYIRHAAKEVRITNWNDLERKLQQADTDYTLPRPEPPQADQPEDESGKR